MHPEGMSTKTRIQRKTLRKTPKNILLPKYKLRGPTFTFNLARRRFTPCELRYCPW